MIMDEMAPNWHLIRQKLSRAKALAEPAARSGALRDIIDEIIVVFESHAPTAWEAHFLMHAIRHVEDGYPAAAAEEIASVLKPRTQQAAITIEPAHLFAASRRTGGAGSAAAA